MELSHHSFLEELLASTPWTSSFSNGFNDFFQNGWNFTSFDDNPHMGSSVFPQLPQSATDFTLADQQLYCNVLEGFEIQPFVLQVGMSDKNNGYLPAAEEFDLVESEAGQSVCKVEMEQMGVVEMGKRGNNVKAKKIEGQPSKNLMAERRRRKRLNDRLSMLRAIVPKISKMDRTSILGDTIDYVKELLERINSLKEEEVGLDSNHVSFNEIFKEGKPNEVLVRNSPKFDVERKERETQIDIRCGSRPGLVLSTVNTLEALGLEIQHCVISCFNDFSMQASCSQLGNAQKTLPTSDHIKEALFTNAGYGGHCL